MIRGTFIEDSQPHPSGQSRGPVDCVDGGVEEAAGDKDGGIPIACVWPRLDGEVG